MRCLLASNNEYMKDFISGTNIDGSKAKQNGQEKLANLTVRSSKPSKRACENLICPKWLQHSEMSLGVRTIKNNKIKQTRLLGASR